MNNKPFKKYNPQIQRHVLVWLLSYPSENSLLPLQLVVQIMTRRSKEMDRVLWPFRAFKRYCKSQYKGSSWVVNSQHGLTVHLTIHSLTFIAIDKEEGVEEVVGFCRPIMLTIQLRLTILLTIIITTAVFFIHLASEPDPPLSFAPFLPLRKERT